MSMTRERVQNPGRSRAAFATRLVGGGVAVGSMLAMIGGVGVASAAPDQKVHKSYVCKYVSKPGEAERLQTGQNPIWVDNHSLLGYDGETYVGQQFKDGQFRSVVIVANTPKLNPEPGVDQCAAPTPPPTTPPTTTTTQTTTHTTTHTTGTHTTGTHTTGTQTTGTSTNTTSTGTGTGAGHASGTTGSSGGATTATTYALQPVNAGATADQGSSAPVQAGWLAAAALGLLALITGGRLPRVTRKRTRSE